MIKGLSKKRILLYAVISAVMLFMFYGLFDGDRTHKKTRFLMDTYCTIQAFGKKIRVERAMEKAFDRMAEVEAKFSVLEPDGVLHAFNGPSLEYGIKDREITDLIRTALWLSAESAGSFDITVFPLLDLWGFYDNEIRIPAEELIKNELEHVGYGKLVLTDGGLMKTDEKTRIDLGAIAKGYAVAEAVKVLKKEGIAAALIDAGGDIYCYGTRRKRLWRVGIRDPDNEGVIGVLAVSDMAVVTSGDYERFTEIDGVKYHHILDPGTGYPADGLKSVTVVSPDPVLADGWSTAFFVLGAERAMKIAEEKKDLEAVVITAQGDLRYSSGIKKYFTPIKK